MLEPRKIVICAVSTILVMGVAIGVVLLMSEESRTKPLLPQVKATSQFCQITTYKDTCDQALGSANTTDLKDLTKLALVAAEEASRNMFKFTESLIREAKNNSDTNTIRALEICRDFVGLALHTLNKTLVTVDEDDLLDLGDLVNDLRTWLSATITFQKTCLEQFNGDKNTTEILTEGMDKPYQHAVNALDIISNLPDILQQLGFEVNNTTSRMLLAHDDGHPKWMRSADRKLIDDHVVKPNAVVARDGSGQFKTIKSALDAAPNNSATKYVIYVKAGIYKECITVDMATTNILMYGDGPNTTVVTSYKNSKIMKIPTPDTATFVVKGDGFVAKSMGFQNTAGPQGKQAVALLVAADRTAFYNCMIDGFQDTLYVLAERQFYRNCTITGTVDFIFGNSMTVIQDSIILVKKPATGQFNAITSHQQFEKNQNGAIVIQGCNITAEQALIQERLTVKTYLGRPWRAYGVHVFMENSIGNFIAPEGWHEMTGRADSDTALCAEYGNTGPGANTSERMNWKGVKRSLTKEEASKYTAKILLHSKGSWLADSGVPFVAGFMKGSQRVTEMYLNLN